MALPYVVGSLPTQANFDALDTADTALDTRLDALEPRVWPATVTSLPSTPTDGQEVYYVADATNGVVWHLKYRSASASAYKWEYVGGPRLVSEVNIVEVTASTVYGNLATVGPSITVPLAGDYDVMLSSHGYANTAGAIPFMSYAIGAAAAVDADAHYHESPVATAYTQSRSRMRRKAGLAAGTALVAKYREAGAVGSATFFHRFMSVTPIRVG